MPRIEQAAQRPGQRMVWEIAEEILAKWQNIPPAAMAYLNPMLNLNSPSEMYGYDSADMILRYFLSNANTWKGDDAFRIKNEIRALLGMPLTKRRIPKA